jgi:hypothetical protein
MAQILVVWLIRGFVLVKKSSGKEYSVIIVNNGAVAERGPFLVPFTHYCLVLRANLSPVDDQIGTISNN